MFASRSTKAAPGTESDALARPRSGDVTEAIREVASTPGVRLDAATRGLFETGFGRDFSGVRVHADSAAAESARRLNAPAYAVGGHLVFDQGQFAPGTRHGRRLIAHELAHVAQQARCATDLSEAELRIGSASDPFERDAESSAARAMLGSAFRSGRGGPSLHDASSTLSVRRAPPAPVRPAPSWLGSYAAGATHVEGDIWSVRFPTLGESWVGPYDELRAYLTRQGFANTMQAAHIFGGEHLGDIGAAMPYARAPCVAVSTQIHAKWSGQTTTLQHKYLGGRNTPTVGRPAVKRAEIVDLYDEVYADFPELREMVRNIAYQDIAPGDAMPKPASPMDAHAGKPVPKPTPAVGTKPSPVSAPKGSPMDAHRPAPAPAAMKPIDAHKPNAVPKTSAAIDAHTGGAMPKASAPIDAHTGNAMPKAASPIDAYKGGAVPKASSPINAHNGGAMPKAAPAMDAHKPGMPRAASPMDAFERTAMGDAGALASRAGAGATRAGLGSFAADAAVSIASDLILMLALQGFLDVVSHMLGDKNTESPEQARFREIFGRKVSGPLEKALAASSNDAVAMTTSSPEFPVFANVTLYVYERWTDSGIGHNESEKEIDDIDFVNLGVSFKSVSKDDVVDSDCTSSLLSDTSFCRSQRRVVYSFELDFGETPAQRKWRMYQHEAMLAAKKHQSARFVASGSHFEVKMTPAEQREERQRSKFFQGSLYDEKELQERILWVNAYIEYTAFNGPDDLYADAIRYLKELEAPARDRDAASMLHMPPR